MKAKTIKKVPAAPAPKYREGWLSSLPVGYRVSLRGHATLEELEEVEGEKGELEGEVDRLVGEVDVLEERNRALEGKCEALRHAMEEAATAVDNLLRDGIDGDTRDTLQGLLADLDATLDANRK